MNSFPKPDARLTDACARLRNNPDFRLLRDHMAKLEQYHTGCLVTAQPPDVPLLQGRVRQLQDLSDLTKDPA